MEALQSASNKEIMRMAILKHEATFKQQVYELHRLYQIQKMLMEGVEKSRYRNRNGEGTCSSRVDRCDMEGLGKEVEDGESNNGGSDVIDESEIELSLGPSSLRPEKRKKMETEGSFRYNSNLPPVSLLLRQWTNPV